MEKKVQISDDKTTAIVTISVSFRGNNPKKEGYTTTDVINMLNDMGYSIDAIVQSTTVSNCSPRKCEGTWIFLLRDTNNNNQQSIPQPSSWGEVAPLIEKPFNMPVVTKTKKVRNLDS